MKSSDPMTHPGPLDRINGLKSEIARLLLPLAIISLVTIVGIFLFEQVSIVYFHQLTLMNAHIFTIVMMGLLTPLVALIILIRFVALNKALIEENEERKKTEKALTAARAQAELYLDIMCHDINNLIQVSTGYLEAVIDTGIAEGNPGEESLTFLNKSLESMKSVAELIKNVGRLQKGQSGELQQKPIDVCEVLSYVKHQFLPVHNRNVIINYSPRKGCFVLANELLTDLYGNVVGNAIKHSSGPLTIDILQDRITENGKQYCSVTIEDNGPGIPDAVKKQLSDRLRQANVRYTGKGFGMCLIKALIDNFGGKFQIGDRVPGDFSKGTRVTVKIPLLRKDTPEPGTPG